MNQKHFLKSKTIHGAIINIISIITIFISLHKQLSPEEQVLFISAILSNIYVIYGRFKAKEKLYIKKKK